MITMRKLQIGIDRTKTFAIGCPRSSSGPVGLYIVSVGYFAARLPGAVAGWLAMITPALLIIPLVHLPRWLR